MEELKLILETVQAAGEGAKLLVILYFVKDIVTIGLIVVGFLGVGKWSIRAIEQNSFLVTVAARFGMTTPLTLRERKDLIRRLEKMMEEEA